MGLEVGRDSRVSFVMIVSTPATIVPRLLLYGRPTSAATLEETGTIMAHPSDLEAHLGDLRTVRSPVHIATHRHGRGRDGRRGPRALRCGPWRCQGRSRRGAAE